MIKLCNNTHVIANLQTYECQEHRIAKFFQPKFGNITNCVKNFKKEPMLKRVSKRERCVPVTEVQNEVHYFKNPTQKFEGIKLKVFLPKVLQL